MKSLEKDEHRGGKQATEIIMAMNDIERAFLEHPVKSLCHNCGEITEEEDGKCVECHC